MRPNDKLLQALVKDSPVLEAQRGSFTSISNEMYIVCAHEEIPMSIGIVREVNYILSPTSPFPADRTGGFSCL
jgi:hypothetical protein